MLKQGLLIGVLSLMSFTCKNQSSKNFDKNPVQGDSVEIKLPSIELMELPEQFLETNGIKSWESFSSFQSSIESLSRMSSKSIGAFLLETQKKTNTLINTPFPELFDKPHIKSRIKVVQTQILKSYYFAERYKSDSLEISLNRLYVYYNALIHRMISLTNEEKSLIINTTPPESERPKSTYRSKVNYNP